MSEPWKSRFVEEKRRKSRKRNRRKKKESQKRPLNPKMIPENFELLYHGSNQEVNLSKGEFLEPQKSRAAEGKAVVFTTPFLLLALCFTQHWKKEFDLGCKNGSYYFQEKEPGAFKKTFSGRAGWIYFVKARNAKGDFLFKSLREVYGRGMREEFFSEEKAEVEGKIPVPDCWKALQEQSVIKLISYAP